MGVPSFQQLMLPALQSLENTGISEGRRYQWAISWVTARGTCHLRQAMMTISAWGKRHAQLLQPFGSERMNWTPFVGPRVVEFKV